MALHSPVQRLIAVVVACNQLWLYSACANVSAPDQVGAARTSAEHLDGATLFRGIFFGEGNVGVRLTGLWDGKSATSRATTPEQVATIRAIEQRVFEHIQKTDPAFLDHFASSMQSGNHVVVERALHEGGLQIAGALDKDPAFAKAKLAVGMAVDPYVDIETYIYAVIALVVFVFEAAVLQPAGTPSPSVAATTPGLQRDQIVNEIATKLMVPAQ